MDWVGCLHCGIEPKKAKLLITSCSHIFCTSCLKSDNCLICKKPTKALEIGPNLPKNVLAMFKDPKKKATEIHQCLIKVLSFQKFHKEHSQKIEKAKFAGMRENLMKRTCTTAPQVEKLLVAKANVEKKIGEKLIKMEKLKELIAKERERLAINTNMQFLDNLNSSTSGSNNDSVLDYDFLGLNLQENNRRRSLSSIGSSTSSYQSDLF